MADTIRTTAAMQALLADNTDGDISAGDVRDLLVSATGNKFIADVTPSSPSAWDDEFDNSSINVAWTQMNDGTAATWSEKDDQRLYLSTVPESATHVKGLVKAMPADSWEVVTKLSGSTYINANHMKPAGMILAEGTTAGDVIYFGLERDNFTKLTRWVGTNWSTYLGETAVAAPFIFGAGWLKIIKDGTNYTFQASGDGNTYIDIVAAAALTFTPTLLGLGCISENSTYPQGGCFEYIRQVA